MFDKIIFLYDIAGNLPLAVAEDFEKIFHLKKG